jgi:hypothetical protein
VIRILAMTIAAGLLTACGNAFYWQQEGRGLADFDRESRVCAADASHAPPDLDKEKAYRACMRAKGWQRVRAATSLPTQFRGPESDEEMTNLASPTSAPNEDAAAARCRANTNWNQPRLTALTEYHQCLRAR